MSPSTAEAKSPLRNFLDWGVPILFIIAGIAVVIYGVKAPEINERAMEKSIQQKSSDEHLRLIEEWELVSEDLSNCNGMGAVLRSIESKDLYTYRLYLVILQSSGQEYIVINDGGLCWVDGDGRRPKLADTEQIDKLFRAGTGPVDFVGEALINKRGKWNAVPILNDDQTVWGVLLVQRLTRR